MERDLPEDDLLHDPVRAGETGPQTILRLLRERGVDDLDDALASDVDGVADRLFDHAELFPGTRLLDLLTTLLLETAHERSRGICERYFLMLDVAAVADEMVLRCYSGYIAGQRQRPFRAWSERVLRETVRWGIDAPEFWVFKKGRDAPPRERILGELSRLSNHLDIQARRVVWLHWVEQRELGEIVAETGVALERAEWVLEAVLTEAQRIVVEDIRTRGDEYAKRRDFERAHGIDDGDFAEFDDDEEAADE